MKKIYALLISILPVAAIAQITVTQSDLPGVGSYYINATDTFYTAAITAGGASQTWNYATLLNTRQDTLGFISAVGTPYASTFPLANLAAHNLASSNYFYFISSSTGFYAEGLQTPGGAFLGHAVVYNPAELLIPVPFTYPNTNNNFARFNYIDSTTQYTAFVDSLHIIQHVTQSISSDGYGALTLPNGPHLNTLRIKTVQSETDSILIHNIITGWTLFNKLHRQTTHYRWVQNGGGSLLLSIDADSAGTTATQSSYLLNYGVLGINQPLANANQTSAYPNPSSLFVTFSFDKTTSANSQLTITNTLGEVVEKDDVSMLNKLTIGTNHFKNGVYFYSVTDEKGNVTSGKFIVQR